MRTAPRAAATALAFALSLGAARPGIAAPLPEAEVLFEEGIRLLKDGKAREACPKLEESQRIDPAPGTQFYLADCYETVGRTASAWSLFVDVADQSMANGKLEQEKKARARAAALKPRLSRLTIVVPAEVGGLAGLAIERDGVPLGRASWGTPIPVDPGKHTVRAVAPKKDPWEATTTVTDPGAVATVEIKPLHDAARPGPLGTRSPGVVSSDESPGHGAAQRVSAIVVGGLGLAGIGLGSAFGVLALDRNHDWKQMTSASCATSLDCKPEAILAIQQTERDRDRFAALSTLGVIGGGVAVTGAVILWVTAPRQKPRTGIRIMPILGERQGAMIEGCF